jgi:2-keto-4-pentenoate hydratase
LTAPGATDASYPHAPAVARRLVAARLEAAALADYPAPLPANLAQGYAVQEIAIHLWPDTLAGWKIGRVPPAEVARSGADRLAGPVFVRAVQVLDWDGQGAFPAIDGGFAAVEGEFVYRLAKDAPPHRLDWTPQDALELVAAMHVGVELAGSPLAAINDLGPPVVASDFGNNTGLILGPEIPGWLERSDESLVCETFVDGRSVGAGTAASLLGGPAGCLAFLAELCAARGRPLKAGQLVTTGQITGIHDIRPGQKARVDFEGLGSLGCIAEQARPQPGRIGDDGGDRGP